jgi:hypothetical protein
MHENSDNDRANNLLLDLKKRLSSGELGTPEREIYHEPITGADYVGAALERALRRDWIAHAEAKNKEYPVRLLQMENEHRFVIYKRLFVCILYIHTCMHVLIAHAEAKNKEYPVRLLQLENEHRFVICKRLFVCILSIHTCMHVCIDCTF